MGNYLRMHESEKENICQNLYDQEVVKTADYLKSYEKYAKVVCDDIPISCYTNFRDALFHFRKLVSCVEEHEIIQQTFAIKEHLGRSRTDAKSSLLTLYSDYIINLLKCETISLDVKKELRILLHKLKSAVLYNRVEGMIMPETFNLRYSEEEIEDMIVSFCTLMQNDCYDEFIILRNNYKNTQRTDNNTSDNTRRIRN